MKIHILKEVSILDSGEKAFHVTPFRKREDAVTDLKITVEELSEQGYRITYEDENEVQLTDPERNCYEIVIEEATLL